jgi:hypothetical protein
MIGRRSSFSFRDKSAPARELRGVLLREHAWRLREGLV